MSSVSNVADRHESRWRPRAEHAKWIILAILIASACLFYAFAVRPEVRFYAAINDVQQSLNQVMTSTPPGYRQQEWQEAVGVTITSFGNNADYGDTDFGQLDELARTLNVTRDPEASLALVWRFMETKQPTKTWYIETWKPVFLDHLERARPQPEHVGH